MHLIYSLFLTCKNVFTPTLSILFLIICLGSCARTIYQEEGPQLSSINIIDHNGFSETISAPDRLKQYENVDFLQPLPYQKVLRTYARDNYGSIRSYITSYYPNGQTKQYLEVLNGRALGAYKEWHSNGKLKVESHVIGGNADISPGSEKTWLFEGVAKVWNEEGSLLAEIPYQKGVLEGISIHYHPNKVIWKKIPYNKNVLEGTLEVFRDCGTLLQTTQFTQDRKNGRSIRYWTPTQIASNETFVEGILKSGSYFDQSGQLLSEVAEGYGFRTVFGKEIVVEMQEYKHGLMEGCVKVFRPNGRLAKMYHLKNGLKHGEEIEFHDHPLSKDQPKLSIIWFEDAIQGLVKTWYVTGTPESQREMHYNAKQGMATAWYTDGSLMFIEEYEKNKLVKGEYYKKGERVPISKVIQGKGIATLFDAEGHFMHKINYQHGKPQVPDA